MREKLKTLAQLAMPVDGGPGLRRLLLASGSACALVVAGAFALGAMCVLFVALASIYLIATRVLGIDVKFDPQAFYEKYAPRASA